MQAKRQVVVKTGGKLTDVELAGINEARRREFPAFESSKTPLRPSPGDVAWDEIYFLVVEPASRLLAFARLREVQVYLANEPFSIFGVVTVVALEKGLGHGRLAVQSLAAYVAALARTTVGFCDPQTSPFYSKCGFAILPQGWQRFRPREPALDSEDNADAFYIDGRDRLVERLHSNEGLNVVLPCPRW